MTKDDGFLHFLKIFVEVRIFNIKDFFRTVWNYYRDIDFAKLDLSLLLRYFWESPYSINRILHLDLYGETPLVTMEKIAVEAQITSRDTVYELGCGRGRCAFWLSHFRGCKTVGIEYNPIFVEKANRLKGRFHDEKTSFILGDMRKVDLRDATCIYLYGTLLSDEDIHTLIEKFSALKKGTRIITISYALNEYATSTRFLVRKEFEVEFSWGKTSAFLQEAKGKDEG